MNLFYIHTHINDETIKSSSSSTQDYRRPSSVGRGNRTPPPPPPPMISNSGSYRGNNNSSGNYRSGLTTGGSGGGGGGGAGRNDRDSSLNRHRSSPKRLIRGSGIGVSRSRGNLSSSSNRGLRTAARGIIRSSIRNRESADLRLMRRKLLYARQRDRQRVLKIQRLTR